jgi:TPP-dependent pyruvate/acetoin dehydrogenase alpha subunit
MAEMYGKIEGCSLGRGGSMHLFDVSKLYGGNAIVSSHLPLAVGMALASKSKRKTISPAVFLAKERLQQESRSDESQHFGKFCVICL